MFSWPMSSAEARTTKPYLQIAVVCFPQAKPPYKTTSHSTPTIDYPYEVYTRYTYLPVVVKEVVISTRRYPIVGNQCRDAKRFEHLQQFNRASVSALMSFRPNRWSTSRAQTLRPCSQQHGRQQGRRAPPTFFATYSASAYCWRKTNVDVPPLCAAKTIINLVRRYTWISKERGYCERKPSCVRCICCRSWCFRQEILRGLRLLPIQKDYHGRVNHG